MLRLPQFGVELPRDVASVIALLRDKPGARIVAGGTDILPNLKHRLDQPETLISLAAGLGILQSINIRQSRAEW